MSEEPNPLVSIITITFNIIKAGRENYFRQNLESVRSQTYKNIEHIIVDGASTDGTADLIREYAERGWIRYISEPDTGIYDAMNKGVRLANGKYISFLNSDDYYHSQTGVEDSVNALEESGADFSYAPAILLKEDGTPVERHPHIAPLISNVFITMPFCHQTMFTKKSAIIGEGLFDEEFKSAGDYEFVIRLCIKQYNSVFVERAFTTYRMGGFSISSNDLSIKEVAKAYYKNYSRLCKITRDECNQIYCSNYRNIPLRLAMNLAKLHPYFDQAKYFRVAKPKRFFKKLIFKLGRFHCRMMYSSQKPTFPSGSSEKYCTKG